MKVLMKLLGSGTVFRGVYGLSSVTNFETFFMISGLGLPVQRIREIIQLSKVEQKHLEKKTVNRTIDDIIKEIEEEETRSE